MDTGTRSQEVDARCLYSAAPDQQEAEDIKRQLDPQTLMEFDCKVTKHPDCCAPCRANNDCERLPMHVGCRCRRDDYLTLSETVY
jgi:hypothetical protein